MDNKKIEYFKSRLLEEKEKAVESLKNMEEREDESNEQMNSELSTYDNHPADIGTEVYMMEQQKGFKNGLEDTIEKIDQSLEDIKNEKYGYCDNCDKMISEERLEVLPYAKTCLGCSDEDNLK
jgi:RNA polymerase-binding transcription factor DksA